MKKLLIVMMLIFTLSGCSAFDKEVALSIPDEYVTEDEVQIMIQESQTIIEDEPIIEDINDYSCDIDGITYHNIDNYVINGNVITYNRMDDPKIYLSVFDKITCEVIINEE